jgi:hypothetical protein
MNMALAIEMSDAPMTKDTITAGSDGDDEDQGDNDQEDAPITQDTINAGGESRDGDEDNSGQKNNNDNNDNEPATTEATEKPDCPSGQENGLFTTCMPIQTCGSSNIGCCKTDVPILSDENGKCANSQYVDPSIRD